MGCSYRTYPTQTGKVNTAGYEGDVVTLNVSSLPAQTVSSASRSVKGQC